MYKFHCKNCRRVFEAQGKRTEWADPIYGPCHKWTTDCPDCKSLCDEYRPKSFSKKDSAHEEDMGSPGETPCGNFPECGNCGLDE